MHVGTCELKLVEESNDHMSTNTGLIPRLPCCTSQGENLVHFMWGQWGRRDFTLP